MEAKAAAVSLSAPLPRCRVSCGNSPLACSASARRSRRCRYLHGAPLRSLARPSSARSFPAGRVYAMAAATTPVKEQDLVFVAGATGKVGSRTVRELIKLGFRVRAAVRSKERASPLVQSVERLELGEGTAAASRLELVECDLEKQSEAGIAAAIGNAALVVCSIGASEKEILDVTGPYRIDYVATANLVRAAAKAGVEHFVLVTSLGTTRFGFPAALLNLFWGVLCWKKMAEEALVASGVPYTIVRPGGMERPTDAYKETHNLVVAPRDTYVGGLVSNLQVAELIACVAKNRRAAYCKVVEVVAETTAPLLPTEDLLARVPSDPGRAPPPAPAAPATVTETTKESPPAAAAAPAAPAAPASAPAAPPAPAAAPPAPAPAPAAAAEEERPLSPYAAYEGLKPPAAAAPATVTEAAKESPTAAAAAPAAPAAPASAPAAAPPAPAPAPAASAAAPAAPAPAPAPAAAAKIERPLSPYAVYEGLKPPSSPTPSFSSGTTGQAVKESPPAPAAPAAPAPPPPPPPAAPTASAKQRPLSPYAAYEGLKPPASPTPSRSSSKKKDDGDSPSPPPSAASPDAATSTTAEAAAESSSPLLDSNANGAPPTAPATADPGRPLSPYARYEDLKPPTTPTPSAPKV